MSVIRGTKIPSNNLILALNAADRNSYIGSGTNWIDLSGTNPTCTLTNGPTFNSSNGGNILFDGSNDYVNITNNSTFQFTNTQPFSILSWVYWTGTGLNYLFTFSNTGDTRGYYIILDSNVLGTNTFLFDYYDGIIQSFRGILGANNSITKNQWIFIAATSRDNNYLNMKLYQNGNLTSYSYRGTASPNNINYTGLVCRIGSRGTDGPFAGNIASMYIYNRELSQPEILSIFNSTKTRFRL